MTSSDREAAGGGRDPRPRAAPRVEPEPAPLTGTVLVPLHHSAEERWFSLRHAIWGIGLAVALGVGAVAIEGVRYTAAAARRAERVQTDQSVQAMQKLAAEVNRLKSSVENLKTTDSARQDETMRGLRRSVEGLKQEIEQVKAGSVVTLAQLSTKIDKTDHDPGPKLAEIMARLDKIDRDPGAKPEAGQKLADLQNRVERIEKQVSAPTATGAVPAPAAPQSAPPYAKPAQQAAAAPSKQAAAVTPPPAPATNPGQGKRSEPQASIAPAQLPGSAKPARLRTWVVRDLYSGLALMEDRNGDLREVAKGDFLPGAGQVRSIERRGGNFVVVTDQGLIGSTTF